MREHSPFAETFDDVGAPVRQGAAGMHDDRPKDASEDLYDLYRSHRGKVTDKWSSYLEVYNRLFTLFRPLPVRLLEIGVQNGGSLEVWAKYFPNAELIVGCDIDLECAHLRYADPRIAVVIADATTPEGRDAILSVSQEFDIIIDDGSHRSSDIIRSFALLYPALREHGIYVVEDLHCGYWREFEGGLYDPYSSVSFFKALCDVVNFQHWGTDRSCKAYMRHLLGKHGISMEEPTLRSVRSVFFWNSVVAVTKRARPDDLGRRMIFGTECPVTSDCLAYRDSALEVQDQRDNPYAIRDVPADAELFQKNQHIAGLTKLLIDRDIQLARLMEERACMIAESQTYGARIGRALNTLHHRLFPAGTLRGRILNRALGQALELYRFRRRKSLPGNEHSPTVCRTTAVPEADYKRWIEENEPDVARLSTEAATVAAADGPLISVVLPVYKVPTEVLRSTVESILRQTYPHWEACIAYADTDNERNWKLLQEFAARDARIRVMRLSQNGGISANSNAAFAMARGEFVALLDHDDELAPWALADMAKALSEDPEIDFLYSDKDCIDATGARRLNPLFKPEWSPEMLYSVNYLTHLNVIRRSLVQAVGGWRSEFDGAQDWDLFYRVTERARKIVRLPGVHYHWRIIDGSTSTGLAAKPYAMLAQLRTQEERLLRLNLPAVAVPDTESGFRLLWRLESKPTVDLVIHLRPGDTLPDWLSSHLDQDLGELLASVTLVGPEGAIGKSTLGERWVSVVEYGASMSETEAALNASLLGNAPVLMFLNGSVQRLAPSSLRELTGWVALHPEIAFATGIALTEEERVLEAGRVCSQDGHSAPLFRDTPLRHWGVFGGPLWYRNVRTAYPYLAGCKRQAWIRTKASQAGRSWPEEFAARCRAMFSPAARGVVTPYARAYMAYAVYESTPVRDASYEDDPYFHPALRSLFPLSS